MSPGTLYPHKAPAVGNLAVGELLGAGGQGEVYRATDEKGVDHALKWFRPNTIKESAGLKERLGRLIAAGAPSQSFLWPERLVHGDDGSFGYLMPLRAPEYVELGDFFCIDLSPEAWFRSNSAKVTAALGIACSINALHDRGLCYSDINEGSFYAHPHTGHILVGDNDNIVDEGMDAGVRGKVRYMAPEVAAGGTPDRSSDNFSLAVILYRIFCTDHPFEGALTSSRTLLTPGDELCGYGAGAVFCHDADDNSNAPTPEGQPNSLFFWPALPEILRDAFRKALSRKAILNPEARMSAAEWVGILRRVRDAVCTCSAAAPVHDFFTDGKNPRKCPLCGAPVKSYPALTFGDGTKVWLHPGKLIYEPGTDTPIGICSMSNVAGRGVTAVIAPVDPDDPDGFFRVPVPGKKINIAGRVAAVTEE